MLLQLPPTLEADIDLLGATLERFPARIQVAVEFRHASWFTGEVRRLLESHQAVLCLADRSGLPPERRPTPADRYKIATFAPVL